MPRRRKTTEPAAAESKGSKSDAIKAALEAHPDKMPKEIAEILQAQGLDVTPQMVSTTKFNLKSKKDQPAAPKAAARKSRAATKAADAVSLDSLEKAKELATQLGGIQQAKAAIAALAELVNPFPTTKQVPDGTSRWNADVKTTTGQEAKTVEHFASDRQHKMALDGGVSSAHGAVAFFEEKAHAYTPSVWSPPVSSLSPAM